MSEKKAASAAEGSKTTAKKKAKKKSGTRAKKETSPADVRKKVSKIVHAKAVKMARAVIGETDEKMREDLQLATVKYLFEMAEIYPPQADQDVATADEDCLAKTLLNRLNIPDVPIRRDEEEEAVAAEKNSSGDCEGKGAVVRESEEGHEPAEG